MQLSHEKRGTYLFVKAAGRLDANWADYFTDTFLNHIRNGHHNLIIDAAELAYLSSAGIRSLLMVYKELKRVKGSLVIYRALEFVKQILATSGFDFWLTEELPEDFPEDVSNNIERMEESFTLDKDASLELIYHDGWCPWQKVKPEAARDFSFHENLFGLGIGSAAENPSVAEKLFGEFLSVRGNVVFQAPVEESRPDYLIAEKQYVPAIKAIQALLLKGEMSELLRFAPSESESFFTMGTLLEMILDKSGAGAAGFLIIGEIEGLVGATLIRSPGLLKSDEPLDFPEIIKWLSFCGERVFSHQQGIISGVVKKGGNSRLLQTLSSETNLAAHMHAAVFPYQPLQNGRIDLDETVQKFFSGPPPLAVMHLVNDERPAVGLGQSALIRGAVWYSPVNNAEVI